MARKHWTYLVRNGRRRHFPKDVTEALAKRIEALGALFREHEDWADVHGLRRVEKAVALIEREMEIAVDRGDHASAGVSFALDEIEGR